MLHTMCQEMATDRSYVPTAYLRVGQMCARTRTALATCYAKCFEQLS